MTQLDEFVVADRDRFKARNGHIQGRILMLYEYTTTQ